MLSAAILSIALLTQCGQSQAVSTQVFVVPAVTRTYTVTEVLVPERTYTVTQSCSVPAQQTYVVKKVKYRRIRARALFGGCG